MIISTQHDAKLQISWHPADGNAQDTKDGEWVFDPTDGIGTSANSLWLDLYMKIKLQ